MKPAVWVVDDSQLAARVACEALEGEFTCTVISSGIEALERLSGDTLPDVLLLDWELPDASGIELCHFIRGRHGDLALPILMVTARCEASDVVVGLAAGANDYVRKPFVGVELLARVSSLARLKQLRRRSAEAEARLKATLRSIGDGVISTDAHGHIIFMNAVAERLTGWREADGHARTLTDILVPTGPTNSSTNLPAFSTLVGVDAKALTGDFLLRRRDRSEVWVALHGSVIRDESGAVAGAVIVFRDIADAKQHEAARELALIGERTRGDFERQLIGIVSHDLRGPLGTVLMGAQLLLTRENVDAATVRTVGRIQHAAERGARMVDDLLDFTQARFGGGIPIVRSSIDLHAAVQQIVDEARLRHPDRAFELLTTGVAKGSWDGDRLAQAVANLVSNAVKYGNPATSIRVVSAGFPETVRVSVHNTGSPIPPDSQLRIFEPMQRATSQIDNSARSVGLGLFIVKQLVHAHGGEVSVSSTADSGTTFEFWIPRA